MLWEQDVTAEVTEHAAGAPTKPNLTSRNFMLKKI